jgi:hypothetical protein
MSHHPSTTLNPADRDHLRRIAERVRTPLSLPERIARELAPLPATRDELRACVQRPSDKVKSIHSAISRMIATGRIRERPMVPIDQDRRSYVEEVIVLELVTPEATP